MIPFFKVNKANRKFVQCSVQVDKNAIRRETIDGIEHIVVNSKTLPDDIVMNNGLYPSEEIEKSYLTLERTLAPLEHPQDEKGNFISASDPIAIHNFHAGAFNQNVKREDGRVSIDKVINVQEAMKTERGKRLLDRINEIETAENPRPLHTSVGVFLEVEELDEPRANTQGDQYDWIARNMVFDHDAILLDSVGAAQPHQGVGIAVNGKGEKFKVDQSFITIDVDDVEEMSHNEIRESLQKAIVQSPTNGDHVVDVFSERVIYSSDDQLFSVPYIMENGKARIAGIPVPVDMDIAYIPKTNQKGDLMKELVLNALKEAGIEVEGLTDAEIFAKYNALLTTNQDSGDDEGASDDKADEADVVANALAPILEKLEGLEAKVNSTKDQEVEKLVEVVVNSEKYPGLNADAAKSLDIETLKAMAANCKPAAGIPLTIVNGKSDDEAYDMPA